MTIQFSIPLPTQPRPGWYEHRPTYETVRFLRDRGFTVYREGRRHSVNSKRLTTWEMKWMAACIEAGVRP